MDSLINRNGSVTSPAGFQAAGVTAGLKASGRPDLALVASECPTAAAAAFTSNLFAAAPVAWDRDALAAGTDIRAVVVNSGVANACTGERGRRDARAMAEQVAEGLRLRPEQVLVSSTGRIGVPLPMDVVRGGIAKALAALTGSPEGGTLAAEAIMTTDTVAKHASIEVEIGGRRVTLGGMTKGAGMIAPRMRLCRPQATMLSYVTTDAAIGAAALRGCLETALEGSFNRILVDGDTSTNDTLVCLANGRAGNPILAEGSPGLEVFRDALRRLLQHLAKEMVLDGEGVSRFVELNVGGAASDADARRCAEAIGRSPLCKTAWFGCDPNWGRILAAAGYSGAVFRPEDVQLDYEGVPVVRDGLDAGTPEEALAELLRRREVRIDLRLGAGPGSFSLWTCDLTYDYVKINADYRT